MSTISQSIHTRCPYGRAKDFLREKIAPLAAAGSEVTRTLRVPVGEHDLTATVEMRYRFSVDPMGFDEPWIVTWTPRERALYPSFTGTLSVRADESWETSMLEIKGEYQPPFGIPGQIFDAAIGKRIAAATARVLLEEIRRNIDARYDAEEAAKIKA